MAPAAIHVALVGVALAGVAFAAVVVGSPAHAQPAPRAAAADPAPDRPSDAPLPSCLDASIKDELGRTLEPRGVQKREFLKNKKLQLTARGGLYAGDHRGEFPFFGTPGDPYAPVVLHGKEIRWGYFRTHRWFWASVVYPEYIDATRDVLEGLDRAESLASQGFPSEIVASRFQMSSTAFADPRFWRDDPHGNWMRTSYFRAMRHADVVHPASKGILGADLGGQGGVEPFGMEIPVGLADGSARTVTSSYLDSKPAVSRPFGALPFAIEATPDGLAGHDF